MGESSELELRDDPQDLVDRAAAGERVTITRDGRPVAELVRLSRPPLTAAVLINRFARLPTWTRNGSGQTSTACSTEPCDGRPGGNWMQGMKVLPLSQLKAQLSEILSSVAAHDRVLITRHGRADAVLISVDELQHSLAVDIAPGGAGQEFEIDRPDWDTFRHLSRGGGLSPDGRAGAERVITMLSELLGSVLACHPVSALRPASDGPALVRDASGGATAGPCLVTRLKTDRVNPTRAHVLSNLRSEPTDSYWRHAILQLEVARVARHVGLDYSYEPAVPGSAAKADVAMEVPATGTFLVESTTLSRAREDVTRGDYEDQFKAALAAIEWHGGTVSAQSRAR